MIKIAQIKNMENSDIAEITLDEGPVFYIRKAYLSTIVPAGLLPGAEYIEEKEEELIDAGLAFSAERKAEEYLARCEQCRSGLEKKLLQKEHSRKAVTAALDYLEARHLLDDSRFCSSWIRSHLISKPQGKIRLVQELCSRGIKPAVAKASVNDFFEHNDETEICLKAWNKAIKSGKTEEKLIKYMIDSGFSYKMINEIKNRE